MEMNYRWLGFYVKDWARMTAFLRDTLGLRLHSQDNDSTLFLTNNNFEIEIFDATQQPDSAQLLAAQRRVMLGFNVKDLPAVVETLKGRGATFTMDIQQRQWGRYIYLSDPEGNQWQLFELTAKIE